MKNKKLVNKRGRWGYFFISPYLIGLVCFVIIPLVEAIRISFSELTVSAEGYDLKWINWENYRYILAVDPNFRMHLVDSFTKMFYQVPVVILFSFFIASLLTSQFKGRGLVRTIVFLPVIITAGAVDSLLSSDYMSDMVASTAVGNGSSATGTFAVLLGNMDLPDALIDFISTSVNGIYDIVVMSAVPIVIFIAALNSVSESIFEAAYVDGATAWEIFWKIKFPLSTPQILTCVVYCLIDSLNDSTNPVVAAIKTVTYEKWKYGYGAAMSFVYMILVFVVLLIVYRVIAKRVTYLE